MAKGSLRESMPQTAKLIDEFRAVFGTKQIDGMIRRGINGEPVFYAAENGHTIGTYWPAPAPAIDSNSPAEIAAETNRERHYREARARSLALTTRLSKP